MLPFHQHIGKSAHRYIIFILISFSSTHTFAQPDIGVDQQLPDDLIEEIVSNTDEEFDYNAYVDHLNYLFKHKIELNNATPEELMDLMLLTEEQVIAFFDYKLMHGDLLSIYELQAIPYFDLETIYKIIPYVEVNSGWSDYHMSLKNLLTEGDYSLFVRYQEVLEDQSGYNPDSGATNYYLGSAAKIYTRFRYTYGTRLSYGITAEKDAGEEFFQGSQKKGFDFYSAHFYIGKTKVIRDLCIGDYEVRIGQGLMMNSGLGFGKSAYVMNIKKEGRILKPYTSVNEALFMRGAATTFNIGEKISVTAFGSSKKIDANVSLTDTTSDEIREVSSLLESGFHRTENELADKHVIDQTVFGGNISLSTSKFEIGISGLHTQLSAPLTKDIKPYNQFEFTGDQLSNASIDYSLLIKNAHFFGETALSDNGGIATLNGVLMSIDRNVQISFLHRWFGKKYQSLFANAFSESANIQNEHGFYSGISTKPLRAWQFDAYVDVFTFPWLKFSADAPSHGTDLLAQLTYKPNKKLEMYFRYRNELKEENTTDETSVDYLIDTRKSGLRYHLSYKISSSVTLKSRVEFSFYKKDIAEQEKGMMIYQDVNFKPLSSPVSFSLRYALFDVGSFDTRIYTYENDVLYAYSIPSFSDKGSRFYIVLKYEPFKLMDIWLRFAQTYYTNRNTIGTGLDEIDGNVKTEVKAQVRLRF